MTGKIPRRDAILAAVAAMAGPAVPGRAGPPIREVRSFRLTETAGLRRFGYPVHTMVPDSAGGRNYRLVLDGRAVPAQFRKVDGLGMTPGVALDFIASPGPMQADRYEVQFGMEVEPGPEPRTGLRVEKRDGAYRVSQGDALTFEIAENLVGFLRSVGSPRLGYFRGGSGGLTFGSGKVPLRDFQQELCADEIRSSEITREGPLAISIRSVVGNRLVPWIATLDLTIPHSKSWIQAELTLEDPGDLTCGLGFDINLLTEGSPILVDLGAGSTVYGRIEADQRMELVAGRAVGEAEPASGSGWVVRHGRGDAPPVFAASTPGFPRPAEGWAHVMDSRRCTALAVADFGRKGARDRISAAADGRLRLARDYSVRDPAPPKGRKTLAFWLHFVPMPVQVGAATSPQAILAPLRVDWDRPPR